MQRANPGRRKTCPYVTAIPRELILLGDDFRIPKYVQDAFRTVGTLHVIAISI